MRKRPIPAGCAPCSAMGRRLPAGCRVGKEHREAQRKREIHRGGGEDDKVTLLWGADIPVREWQARMSALPLTLSPPHPVTPSPRHPLLSLPLSVHLLNLCAL